MTADECEDDVITSCVRPSPVNKLHVNEAVRAYDDVLAMISHDLKNPLNTILLAVERLEDSRDDATLRMIERAANRMQRLIADLSDAQRMADGRLVLDRAPTSIAAVVAEVWELLEPQAQAKALATDFDVADEVVHADRSRLVQVLANLVGNAVKFTPARGRIAVVARREGHDVLCEVQDTGPGISKEGLVHVFDRYWRATGTAPTGTGLGLYIAHRIVEAHGGQFWVESSPGAGSMFRFSIPIAGDPSPHSAA